MSLYFGETYIGKVLVGTQNTSGDIDTSDATLTSGAQMLYPYTAYANGQKFTGSIQSKDSDDITVSGRTVTVPAGHYAESATVNVPGGGGDVSLQAKTNISPSTSSQTITADSGYDGLSSVQINAMPSGTAGTPTATKGAVSNHSISITPSVTNSTGYITGGTKTGAAVSVSASELVSGTKSITANGTGIDVTTYSSIDVAVPGDEPVLQSKSVNPTESVQTITADSGYDGLGSVEVGAISPTYIGSDITQRSSTSLTVAGATVTAPAGYYEESASKTIASGSATTPATTVTANPTIEISATGLITATASASKSVTPTVSAGYVSSGTAGTITVSGSKTEQLTTQAAKTVTPTETEQVAVAANTYTTGQVKVGAISSTYVGSGITQRSSTDLTASGATITAPAGYYQSGASKSVASGSAGTPTATKGTVSNHAISVTPSVTNTTGYITGGTKTGTAVSVSASELVSGTLTISASGTHDVTNYESASVASGGATASATKGTVSNHSVTVTPSVTRTAGYVTAGTASGTAVTVSASELVSGSQTVTDNGTVDCTNLASIVVAIPIQHYYTGSSAPSSSLGVDGDIYLKTS